MIEAEKSPQNGLPNGLPAAPAGAVAEATAVCARHRNDPAALLEILHDLQDQTGYIPEAVLPAIASALNLSRAEVHGVVSFYHDYRRAPAGPVVVKLCRAEACQSMGALALIETVCAARGIALGGTSEDGVTIEPVYCLGNCALAPAAMVNGRLVGRADAGRLDTAVREACS
ncbi:NAD(P)H-dependent oxidoreductase subunit E [Thalassobaculum litoreum]|uniref:Formate dehydrogenase gamma subunit n=1 Tax=Thalassobaculum litoreum DSM 18839 TaxID=1123362 RepID=A0A8G2EZW6_9PROT|nr:NAD(P)H-dependent oxidoreductase subunit E [Thalassobaculum litoreum]SDG42512.1 formate dehydrogenase gamma subunit [Thalassobaculum litoreum DSM 18839]